MVEGKNESWVFMRNLHNRIKQTLISNVMNELGAINDITLLDVSVGRGGDLDKWNGSGIGYVVGIDPDKKSIIEAIDRRKKKRYIKTKTYFEHTPADKNAITCDWGDKPLSEVLRGDPKLDYFDIVSCQFSLHYFFKSKQTLENAIKNISNSLIPGGYFIGTVLNGDFMKKNVKKLSSGFTERLGFEETDGGIFGSYKIDLIKEQNDEEKRRASLYQTRDPEYYTHLGKLVNICKKYDLKKVKIVEFTEWNRKLKFKLRDYEQFYSSLHVSFVFQKVLKLE